jgi:hypothetical protein
MPPDNRSPGSVNPSGDFDNLDDVVGLVLQFLAQFAGNSVSNNVPPPAYTQAGANAQNLSTLQQMVAGATNGTGLSGSDIKIAQQGNQRALTLAGLTGVLADICQFLDPFGDVMFGVGIQGVYSNGNGFYANDRYGCNAIALNPLVAGESGVGAGVNTYGAAQSTYAGTTLTSGNNYLNWQGAQDDWSGADMTMFVPVTTTGTSGSSASVNIGATLVLTGGNGTPGNLTAAGSPYTSLQFLPVPGSISSGQSINLWNNNGWTGLTATTNGAVSYDATSVAINSMAVSSTIPAFSTSGNAPTTIGIVGQNVYPWQVNPLYTRSWPSGTAAGQVDTLVFRVPNKWFFGVTVTNATIGALQGLSV